MLGFNPRKSKIFKISRFLLVFVLIFSWVFSGYPQILNFPPEMEEVEATAERQSPDAIIIQTNLSGAITDIQDDPDGPDDGNWLTTTGSNSTLRVSYLTPTGNPIAGTDLQEFRLWLRKDAAAGGDPTCTLEVYDGGSLHQSISINNIITSATGEILFGKWDASGLTNSDGSGVELRLVSTKGGGGPNERNIEVGAVEWNVDYSTGPSTTFIIGGTETGTKDTSLTTITFPADVPESTISTPYNNLDGAGDPQVLSADASAPVAKIKNTGSSTYNIVLEITTWTNSVVNMEYYRVADDAAVNIDTVTAQLSNANGASRSVSTAIPITAGAYKDLYLKLLLGSIAGKSSTSTLTILGETP